MAKMQLVIEVDESGQLGVGGDAVGNKLIAYGMLELAKEAVLEYHAAQQKRIQAATPAERLAIAGGLKG